MSSIILRIFIAGNLPKKSKAMLLFAFPRNFALHLFTSLFATVIVVRGRCCWLWVKVVRTVIRKITRNASHCATEPAIDLQSFSDLKITRNKRSEIFSSPKT